MPTYERLPRFDRDWEALDTSQQIRFRDAVARFVEDLEAGVFRPGLRVKGVAGAAGVFEMTWAPDGRATFSYGPERGRGSHVIWRRIGTHAVLRQP